MDGLQKALQMMGAGNRAGAAAAFTEMLRTQPDHIDALYLLGTLRAEQADYAAAETLLARAGALAPTSPYIFNNLGNVHLLQQHLQQAADCFSRAIANKPDLVEARVNLGVLLRRLNRGEEARKQLQEAMRMRPDMLQARINLAGVLLDLDEDQKIVELLTQTLAQFPEHPTVHEILGIACERLGQGQQAVHHLQRYLELAAPDADASEARLRLARLGAGPLPQRYPERPLQVTYERKARSWDEDVKRPGMEFLGPQNVAAALRAALPPPDARLLVADLGCGTGLCGPLLRPYAARLDGVDLSQPMLDQATAKALYDSLACADLLTWLDARPAAFDLAVASGVLILFGDLVPVLAAVGKALSGGGRFVFTLYRSAGADIEVRSNMHFAHTADYVRRAAATAGLAVDAVLEAVHEFDHGIAQPGLLVTLSRVDPV